MKIIYLCVVFCVIVVLLACRRPLYQAVSGGLLTMTVLFGIPFVQCGKMVLMPFIKWSSFSVLLIFYLITFLQRILESRKQIKLAQQDLNEIFNNRRVNTAGAPLFIGLLPSAAAMILCSDIVKDGTEGYLEPEEQAFTASWFRHIPESVLPTYTAVLLMLNLSGVKLTSFLGGMVIPVFTLALIGYFSYLRKIPRETGAARTDAKGRATVQLFGHLWTLILILVLIIGFGMDVVYAVLISIFAAIPVYRIRFNELRRMFISAFEKKILFNTFLVLVLKEFITYTGVLEMLPEAMEKLPLPGYLIFAVLFFAATLLSGSTAAIAMGTPLAFSAIPGGMPLMVYLMCITHAASQLSPTHVCLVVASEYFHISLGKLIRKTLPFSILFCVLMTFYYNILLLL
ncbi:MAG: DUF401 family protein [Lachnospiraceae bacterium]